MKRLMIAAAALALAGCTSRWATEPFALMAATETAFAVELPDTLAFDPFGGRAARYQAAVVAAEEHCRKYGKAARLVSDTQGEYTLRRVAFECR